MILFWTGALGLVTLLYVVLDGFDLGVGILFGLTREEGQRRGMLASISPVWDGNETWLILAATTLFGAFSKAFAALLAAFYLPFIILLCALILRGVAFEFRYKSTRLRWLWDAGFAGGSTVAAFLQGVTIGQLAEGLPLKDDAYVGGALNWLNPFALLCGVGLCFGYALLGAAWLVNKTEGKLRARAYQQLPVLLTCVLAFLVAAFFVAAAQNLPIMHRWLERPYLAVFPVTGFVAVLVLVRCIMTQRQDQWPFRMVALIFAAAFGTLAVSFWPYMIPFGMTIQQAAGPPESLSFMLWGAGILVLPVTLIYTFIVYRVFRGKTADAQYH
ncbi:MAG: cytochrome d ubiquinol oxidase subunit II [Caulobacteraceae bacterium]